MTNVQLAAVRKVVDRHHIDKPGRIPAVVYRGVRGDGSSGAATYGRGLYTTAERAHAKQFAGADGKVLTFPSADVIPSRPFVIQSVQQWGGFWSEVLEALGMRESEFSAKFGSVDALLKPLGFDGVQIGKGNNAFFVRY